MTSARDDLRLLLPLRVRGASFAVPTLLLDGEAWSLSATCDWTLRRSDGDNITDESVVADDAVWDLVGDEISGISWRETRDVGLDPTFAFVSGATLTLTSDAAFDTWVIHAGKAILVGPLIE